MQKRFKRISISKVKTPKGYVVTSEYRDINDNESAISPMAIFPRTLFDGLVPRTPTLSRYDGDWS